MISEAETLKSKEIVKRRILRLQQVREQSKDLAKKIRNRVNDERDRALREINAVKAKESEKEKEKNIEHLKSQLEEGLSQVGVSHSAAIFEDLLEKEWQATKLLNRKKAFERGKKAAKELHSERNTAKHHPTCSVKHKNNCSHIQQKKCTESENSSTKSIQPVPKEIETVDANSGDICKSHGDVVPKSHSDFVSKSYSKVIPIFHSDNILKSVDKEREVISYSEENAVKNYHTVDECGDRNIYGENRIIPNYIEVPSNKDCEDSLRNFYPVETIRQLKLSDQLSTVRERLSIPKSQETVYSEAKESVNLHAMSKNNPFSTAVSDHIKKRQLDVQFTSQQTEATNDDESNDLLSLRSLIQHTRCAPPLAPTIPELPAGYKKLDETVINPGIRKSELTPATNFRLPPSMEKVDNSNCKCSNCYCDLNKRTSRLTQKPNFRQTLKTQNPRRISSCSSVSGTPKYVMHKPSIRCKPKITVRIETSTNKSKEFTNEPHKNQKFAKQIRSYDEASKTEHTSIPDSNYLVERLPRDGKSAFELARNEDEDARHAADERRVYYNDQARRVRGAQAANKLQREKEYQSIIKIMEEYERQHRKYKKGPPAEIHMSDHRLKQKYEQEQKKMEEAYKKVEKQAKDHIYSESISAPVVQPERKPSSINKENKKESVSNASSDEAVMHKRRSPLKMKSSKSKPSVVNVAEWNVISNVRNDDDLDEIPTRDSDSVKSITISKSVSKEHDQNMHVDRVLSLVAKQKEELLKELAKLEKMKKRKLKKKSPKKKKQDFIEGPNNSTTDEAVQVEKKKSPVVKVVSNSSNEDTVKVFDNNQLASNSSQSSVSFKGLHIVVEVKKSGKTEKKEAVRMERSVQTTKSLLESQDSSTEVSIKQVISTEKVTFESDDPKSWNYIDSSTSTSYMSPPDRFTKQAVETYFGKKNSFKTTETQTDNKKEYKQNSGTKISNETSKNWKEIGETQWVRNANVIPEKTNVNVFFGSESTISCELPENSVQQNKDSIIRTDQGTQYENSNCIVQEKVMMKNVLRPVNNNVETSSNLDPQIKSYIRKLLEISKPSINKIECEVSDVTTPGSSVINISSNVPIGLKSEYVDKVERLKHFIDENYTLLEQIEKGTKFHKKYAKNGKVICDKQCPEVSSSVNSLQSSDNIHNAYSADNICENKENQTKKHRSKVKWSKQIGTLHKSKDLHRTKSQFLETVGTTEQDKVRHRSEFDVAFVSDLPKKHKAIVVDNPPLLKTSQKEVQTVSESADITPETIVIKPLVAMEKTQINKIDKGVTANVQNFGDIKIVGKRVQTLSVDGIRVEGKTISIQDILKQENIDAEYYKKLSEECSERIQNLSHKLEQVRKDKQNTLSTNTSPCSDDGFSISSNTPKTGNTFVPILQNIPKPVSGNVNVNSPNSTEKTTYVWDFIPQPAMIQPATVPPLNLDMFPNGNTERRPRPPVAMFRNPIMKNSDVNLGTPHELSTIVEVETPGPRKNTSSISRLSDASPVSFISSKIPRPEIHVNVESETSIKEQDSKANNKRIPPFEIERDVPDVNIAPFVSFQEFAKDSGIAEVDNHLGDATLKADSDPPNKVSDSEDTLPDVMAEMLKRDLIRRQHNSSHNGSGENTTSDSAVYVLQENLSSDSKSERRDKYPNLKNLDLPSMSGIENILLSSTSSSVSEDLMNDFEKALQTMGIHWAISTLKKTKESMALSSSSTSVLEESNKNKNQDNFAKDFSNITGTSVGLSTLLAELNTSDNSLFAKYAADLSNSSMNKQMDLLLQKVAEIKTKGENSNIPSKIPVQASPKRKGKKPKFTKKVSPNAKVNLCTEESSISGLQASKDKTQHRTSTPVNLGKLSSHSTSTVSAVSHPSNGLFSNESDLSSVKNVSNPDKNVSADDKDTLNVPDMSLKFGKLFDSTSNNDCTQRED